MIHFSHFQHIMKYSYKPVAIDTQGKVDRKSRPFVPLLKKRDSGVFCLGDFVNVGKYHQFRNLDETRTCQVFQFDPKTLATF